LLNLGDRLKEERTALGMNQQSFADRAGVSKTTQFNYEKGTRQPDAVYLAAISEMGVDVMYVLTGSRSLNSLAPDESSLLDNYRHLCDEQRDVVFKVSEVMSAGRKQGKNFREG
jgi:transcriptional regulator with XRE-family HTH domain